MSSDLIGRRRASEQRLDRARSLELALKEKTDILVETTGLSIEQLDFDGSFRAALTALAAVAARRTHFDVIVTLPDAPFAMRIQHINNAVSAEVLVQRDGTFEPIAETAYPEVPAPSAPAQLELESELESEASGSYLGIPQAYLEPATPYTGVSFSETSESYAAASGTYGASGSYVVSSETYVANSESYPAASGTYSRASEAYSGANGVYSNANNKYLGANQTYAENHETYSGTAEETFAGTSETYSEASEGYSEVPGPYPDSPKPRRDNSPGQSPGVASDLADLLWQGMDDMPS